MSLDRQKQHPYTPSVKKEVLINFPVSEDCASRIFSLPMHPYLTEQEQTKIAEVLYS
ncbi:MAG: DegT/DnrJ/EryC1/StrS family aminotransferase [Smithella sp.]|nr:DegT/DnrJ/EryC1/StrS family aminotransferase [Smithella sp.]